MTVKIQFILNLTHAFFIFWKLSIQIQIRKLSTQIQISSLINK